MYVAYMWKRYIFVSMCLIELHNGHTLTLNSLFTTTPTTFVTDRVNNIVIIQSN